MESNLIGLSENHESLRQVLADARARATAVVVGRARRSSST